MEELLHPVEPFARVLLNIVQNTPEGVLIYCPNVNDLCRDIHEATGVMLRPERQTDEYTSYSEDSYGNEYVNTRQRTNQRKYLLKKSI